VKVINHPQGSAEWLQARVGLVTASRVSDIVAKTKASGYSSSRANYLGELVAERLTGVSAASDFINDDMRRGVELEPDARFEYEAMFGKVVQTVGLVLHPTLRAGASPDGLVDDEGLIEIKCPRTHVHIECLETRKPPAKYLPQMAWQCICTGRAWCDFVSYDPKMPERLRLFAARYIPDAGYLRELEAEVAAFIAEVNAKVEALSKLAA
jgi:putative phage-type endonuclease